MEPLPQTTEETPVPQVQPEYIAPKENLSPAIPGEPKSAQMRTFSTDLAEELRKHQGSAMKIAVMENERRFKEQEMASNNPKKNSRFVLAGFLIFLLSIVITTVVFFYQKSVNTPPPVVVNKIAPSIIQSEDLVVLNVTGKAASDIDSAINTMVKTSTVQTGMIDSVYITQGATGTETRLPASMFLSNIGAHITPEFSNALAQDYMVGIYSYVQPNLFLILKGTQHDFLLSGMLQWEPYLTQDLAPMFGIDTSGNSAYLLNTPYTETLIENHDTRAILDVNKKPVLFYSFLDENTIIITNDSKTLTEAVRRMSS